MKFALIAAALAFGCSGCAILPPVLTHDAAANANVSYDYKGDMTRDGGTDCWYYCP